LEHNVFSIVGCMDPTTLTNHIRTTLDVMPIRRLKKMKTGQLYTTR
jgi:hypothetical protein